MGTRFFFQYELFARGEKRVGHMWRLASETSEMPHVPNSSPMVGELVGPSGFEPEIFAV